LEHGIEAVIDAPPLDQVHWGVLAVDVATGRTLYARNDRRKFVPASNMKLLVTASALGRLGPDHRFETSLWAGGPMNVTGVLDGDLVVVADGDPTLSARYWPDDGAALRAMADSLLEKGLRAVRGALVVDASAWDSTTVAGTWMADNLPGTSSSTGGAFAIAEGETRLIVTGAAAEGGSAGVVWEPLGESAFVQAEVVSGPPGVPTDLSVAYHPETRRLRVTGRVAVGAVDTIAAPTRDPVRQAAAALYRALDQRGIGISGGWRVEWERDTPLGRDCRSAALPACSSASRLAGLRSPPLMEIVEGILEPSQNWMAEQLVRSLGATDSTRAGWSDGLAAVREYLVSRVGVDSLDVSLRDGSGLSAYNLVTPRAVVAILLHAARQPWGPAYRTGMAEPGEEGSTLASRLDGLEGRLFAKTGTISNVNSLSGYLVTDQGREVVFSILTNGSGLPASLVRDSMDRLVRTLASSSY
jgi:D-alanyl-D-alanine carboxypeptidase/D-alanyl-D-alanine-endopeptidase (penicillin-binding protein 4)